MVFTGCFVIIERNKKLFSGVVISRITLTKPWVVVLGLLHHLCTLLPLVRLSLLLVVLVRLAHHHDVLAASGNGSIDSY